MIKARSPNKSFRKNHRTNGVAPSSKAPLKGLFSNGIWKCNCDPRLPASHFQTKNGGKNHGRWFYTCQHPQPRRCGFFLWDDEAKGREAVVVLRNERSEPVPGFEEEEEEEVGTPRRVSAAAGGGGLLTPLTGWRGGAGAEDDDGDGGTPYTPSKPPAAGRAFQTPTPSKNHHLDSRRNPSQATTTAASSDDEREEFFDWPASDDEAMGKAVDRVSSSKESSLGNNNNNRDYMPMPPPETPRKVQKVDAMSTPGKRKRGNEMGFGDGTARVGVTGGLVTPVTASRGGGGDDVFTTPATSTRQGNLLFGTATADITPTPIRYYKDLPASADSELATEILESLQTSLSAPLFSEAREKVKAICNRHVMYTKGIMKGRDVSRAMVKKKEEQLVALQGELDGLRSERETDRAVIRHLRRELGTRGTEDR